MEDRRKVADVSSLQWMNEARCAEIGDAPFFPEHGEDYRQAVAVCNSCPVKAECLEHAIRLEQSGAWNVTGIWGGLTAKQRKDLRSRTLRIVA